MGKVVICFGKSGAGKSTSLRNFGEDEIVLFNVEGKDLPFRKKFKYTIKTDDINIMLSQIKKMPCKVAVIDDAGYIMTHYFMNNHRNKSGNKSFEMYDDIADMIYMLITKIKTEVEDDKIIYIMFHEDSNDYGDTKIKTIGRLLDSKVCIEGMVTICLRYMSSEGKHFIRTNTDGSDIAKSPIDMFDSIEIDNDLKVVDTTIREYYGINKESKE